MSPPPFKELMQRAFATDLHRFTALYSQYADSISQQRYLPWDELRYRPMPPELSAEEWWLVTKMARQGMLRRLPLTDTNNVPFQYALPDEVLREIEFVSTNMSGL